MKKIILAAASLLVICSYSASAQFKDCGIKTGLNLSTITKVDDTKMKPSIYAGIFAEFTLIDDMLGIQPELLYSRQGWKSSIEDVDVHYRMNYLNMPIMFKLYLIDGLSLDLGPQFGIMLDSRSKAESDGKKIKEDIEGLKNFDVSFDMGLSYGFSKIDITARYQLGLTKIADAEDNPKNSNIQIGLGYKF